MNRWLIVLSTDWVAQVKEEIKQTNKQEIDLLQKQLLFFNKTEKIVVKVCIKLNLAFRLKVSKTHLMQKMTLSEEYIK